MNKPKVSVIIPVFQVEEYIESCARSLFAQTLEGIEFIFVDDCTPDQSINLLNKLIDEYQLSIAEKSFIIRIERMPTNSGLAAVRRHGIQLATGDYIIHCDSDDTINPNTLEVMYNIAKRGNYDVVTCEIEWSNGYEPKFVECRNNIDLIKASLTGKVIESICTKLVRKSIYQINGFIIPEDNVNEDCVFSTQIAYYCNSFKQLPNKFYHYNIREGSLSHVNQPDKILDNFNQFKRNIHSIERFLSQKGIIDEVQKELDYKKLTCKNYLAPIAHLPQYRNIWLEAFPEVKGWILFNSFFSLRKKCIYYCVKFNVYNLLRPIFSKQGIISRILLFFVV